MDAILAMVEGATRDDASKRLAPYGFKPSVIQRWRQLRKKGKDVPGPRGSVRKGLQRFAAESHMEGVANESAPVASLDEWGATNARTMAGLKGSIDRLMTLLEKDQVVIGLRARAELLRLELQARDPVSEPTSDQQKLAAKGKEALDATAEQRRKAEAAEKPAARKGGRPADEPEKPLR